MPDEPYAFLHGPGAPPARRRIVSASLRLFSAEGVAGTTIRDIGAAAGCTNPALYKHFSTKEELADRILEDCREYVMGRLGGAAASADWFIDRLDAFLSEWCRCVEEVPYAYRYLRAREGAAVSGEEEGKADRATLPALVAALIEKGKEEGKLASGLSTRFAAISIAGALDGVAEGLQAGILEGPAGRWEETLRRQVRRVLFP